MRSAADARIFFRHTHAYPGCRASMRGIAVSMAVEFSDGASAVATVESLGDGSIAIDLDAHVTAKGRAIQARRWLLEPDPEALAEDPNVVSRWIVRRRLA